MRMLRPEGRDQDPRGRAPRAEAAPSRAEAPRRRRIGLPLLTAALLVPGAVAFGAAWTLPRGTGQAIVTTTYTQGTQYMRPDGVRQRLPEYSKVETTALVQYGLTDDITLVAMPSFMRARTGGAQADDYLGLGYTDIGARARIWHDEQGVISLQALGRIAGADNDRRPAQFGNTDNQLELRLLAGRGFTVQEMNGWVNFEAAYRARLNDAPNEWRFDLSVGLRPRPELAFLAQSFNVISDGDGRGAYPSYWYSKAQLSVLYDVAPNWTLQAGAFTTLGGQNALREHGGLISLWRSF
jgi:hypothetical protein